MIRLPRLLSPALLTLLSGCQYAHDGWAFRPFEGPGYDLSEGLSSDIPADQPLVLASTYLPVIGIRDARKLFDTRMEDIQTELDAAPEGLVGYSLASKLFGQDAYRTITVWESEDAMYEFVTGDAHSRAMADMGDIAVPGESLMLVTTIQPSALPPAWDTWIERIEAEGVVAY